MPTYLVTDPQSGRKVKLTGDSPPTDAELEDIFSGLSPIDKPDQGFFRSPSEALEQATGMLETGATLASGIVGDIAGGVAGLVTSLIPGTAPGSGAAVSNGVREQLTIEPRTERGKQNIQAIGEEIQTKAEAFKATEEHI